MCGHAPYRLPYYLKSQSQKTLSPAEDKCCWIPIFGQFTCYRKGKLRNVSKIYEKILSELVIKISFKILTHLSSEVKKLFEFFNSHSWLKFPKQVSRIPNIDNFILRIRVSLHSGLAFTEVAKSIHSSTEWFLSYKMAPIIESSSWNVEEPDGIPSRSLRNGGQLNVL